VTYTRIVRGAAPARAVWTADVAITAGAGAARDLAGKLRAAGFGARVRALPRPHGFRVRSGRFATEARSDARVAAIRAAGLPVRGSVTTAEDGGEARGPWVVHVLRIDPRAYRGRIVPVLSNDVVAGRETVSSLSARFGALAGVNGGYFTIGDADGTPGDAAGSSVLDGTVVSEAVDGRTDLLLGRTPSIAAVRDRQSVTAAEGATRVLDGDNRAPGLIRACGGAGGDLPTESPLHDITCTDPSELIRFTPIFGTPTPAGEGVEAVLDARGFVTVLRPRGGPVPTGGSVLAGTGEAAGWLAAHAGVGTRLRVRSSVRTPRGPLAPHTSVVNGGPRLLPRITAEGFDHPGDPGFYYAFALRRNPRTIAGVTRRGRLLLVAVDGHAPGYSAGLSFAEEARVMRALGARDAVNLDGGGSTAMTVRGRLVTRPSDETGERPIGDAVLLLGR
jgi:Phosphodiester glycosidase